MLPVQAVEDGMVVFTVSCHRYAVLDHAFYDDKVLSLLLLEDVNENGRPALVLLPTAASTEADGSFAWCTISLNSSRERFFIDELW